MMNSKLKRMAVISVLGTACYPIVSSFAEETSSPPPQWTHQSGRTVVGGDVMFWGMGIGDTPEKARFKAEAMAERNAVTECTLAHKEIRIWDRWMEQVDGKYRAYARAGIAFSSCEEAKSAKSPLRETLINQKLEADLKEFSEIEHQTDDTMLAKVKAWVTSALERITTSLGKTDKQVAALNKKVDELSSKSPVIVQQQIVMTEVRAPASAVQYESCMRDYRNLMANAQAAANSAYPPGNLTAPAVAPLYNKATRKLGQCKELKPSDEIGRTPSADDRAVQQLYELRQKRLAPLRNSIDGVRNSRGEVPFCVRYYHTLMDQANIASDPTSKGNLLNKADAILEACQ